MRPRRRKTPKRRSCERFAWRRKLRNARQGQARRRLRRRRKRKSLLNLQSRRRGAQSVGASETQGGDRRGIEMTKNALNAEEVEERAGPAESKAPSGVRLSIRM